jgi:GNAT superfamily N-acetyltransferase
MTGVVDRSIGLRVDIVLRPAMPADAGAVADVLIRSREAFLPYAPFAHPLDEVRGWVAETLVPGGGVTVAVAAGEIAGVLATSYDDASSWIDQLDVLPGWVGRGVGSRRLALAHERLDRPIRLYTFQENARARAFYEQHGYVPIRFTDGRNNEEHVPDVLYELTSPSDD